ncbi:unnamed protein product [Lupinus luteus]|uniref:Pentatricopeptide repeat-containing protein n=1 Tax=Lupinus luteus TaxID=3873 RepID=A0AAV1WPF7_LUPLU
MNGYVTAVVVEFSTLRSSSPYLNLNDRYGISYADNDKDDDEEDESEIEDEVEGEEGLDTQDGADEAIKMGSERVRRKNHSVTHSNAFIPPQSQKAYHYMKLKGVSHSLKAVSENNNGGSFIARRRLDITTRIIGASKTIRLSRDRWWEEVVDLFYDMMRDGVSPDEFLMPKIVQACGKCRDLQTVELIHFLVIRDRFWEEAVDLFYDMMRDGVSPDEFLMPKIVQACGKCRDLETVELIHFLVIRCGMCSSTRINNSILVVYAKHGEM